MNESFDAGRILEGLYDFQRATVEHAFDRLYLAPDGSRRFLVADETGEQATVLAVFANRGDADELVSVRVGDQTAEPEGGPLEIPARGTASIGPGHTRVDVAGVGVEPGRRVDMEFIFASGPRATANVLVQPDEGIYAGALD